MEQRTYFGASDVLLAEQESLRTYVAVTMRMLSTRPNRNRQGVTEAFIDEIVANQEKYVCTPLYADEKGLLAHNYNRLGHMYDPRTGVFQTDQIGGFSSFWKVEDEYGMSLYGEARIPKREADICAAICDMYSRGKLNFSFEITYVPDGTITEDGVLFIDANPSNALTGMAVVSVPAYPEATALALVAEQHDDQEDLNTGTPVLAEGMSEEENKDEVNTMPKDMESVIAEETKEETPVVSTDDVKDEAIAENTESVEEQETSEGETAVSEEASASTSEVVNVDTLGSQVEEHVTEEIEVVSAEEKTPDQEETQTEDTTAEIFEVPDPGDPAPVEAVPVPPAAVETVETIEEHHLVVRRRLESVIAELEAKVADYDQIKAELETYRAEAAQREHDAKVAKAESFAKHQGLDVSVAEVKEAIEALDYEKLADLSMANAKEEPENSISVAEAVNVICEDMKIGDQTYGGLISNL